MLNLSPLFLVTLFIFNFLFRTCASEALQVSTLSFFERLQPGEKKQLKITLSNEKNQTESISLKLCDYWCDCEGHHFFEGVGKQIRTNAPWINLQTHRETLGPGQQTNIYLSVTVPNDSNLKGSYWSVLLIEPSDSLNALPTIPKSGIGLNIKVRFACHIVTDLGNGSSKIKLIQKEVKTINHIKFLCIDIANYGDTFLNPTLALKLYNDQGILENTLESPSERLYPGSSQRYFLNATHISEKKFNAFLVLDNGDNNLFCDHFPLYFP